MIIEKSLLQSRDFLLLASKDKCNVINMAFVNGTVLELTYN